MDPVDWTFRQIPMTPFHPSSKYDPSCFETLGQPQNKNHGQQTFHPFFKGDGQGSQYLTFLRALLEEQQRQQRQQSDDQSFGELSFRDQDREPCRHPTKKIGMGNNIPISFGAGSLYETSCPIENAESDDSELIAIIETITVTKIIFPGNDQQVMIVSKKREIVTN